MISKTFKSIIATLVFGLLFSFSSAKAQSIDLEYPVGTNLNGNKIFDYSNIYPGWETSETIRVENDSNEDVNLFFTVDLKSGTKKLAEKLKLYVIRAEDGSYRIGGEGDRYDLEEADGEDLYMDQLSAEKGKEYRIKIKFDEEAGNEFQGLETRFDMDFEIESQVIEGEDTTEEEILAGQGRVVTGEEPEVEGVQTSEEEEVVVGGEGGNESEVAGASTECNGWQWWVWALILAGFLVVFYKFTLTKENKESENIPWFWRAGLLVGAVVFWWYFDNCREFVWFLIGSLVGGGVEYGFLIWTRREKEDGEV